MGDRYYWLKLKRDFFKRHDIRIIEAMPNGKDYILFYLKLLCESVDHNGNLRFSERIPYSEEMLATLTDTNVDIVRAAVTVFTELGMMEILDDGTYFMTEVERMIGSAANNDNANRQRRFRERQKQRLLEEGNGGVTGDNKVITESNGERYGSVTKDNESKSIDIDIDKEKEIKKKEKVTRFVPPTREEVADYCRQRGNRVDPDKWMDFYQSKGWMVGKNHMKDWKASIRTWERDERGGGGRNRNRFSKGLVETNYGDMTELEKEIVDNI